MLQLTIMERIIWRSRASAILGLLVMFLPFSGLPTQYIKYPLFFVLGFLITILGFTGARRGVKDQHADHHH
jgi:hypothetical protein